MMLRRLLVAASLVAGSALPALATGEHAPLDRGAAIYLRGALEGGAPLVGARESGRVPATGADAACVNCHRHSGLGSTEGFVRIPPVTGRYLTHPRATNGTTSDLPYVENMHADREPYTDETLARAIRDGIDAEGRTMSVLMPRYTLGDADMAALIAYLKGIDRPRLPGVTNTTLHFATIVTADADPAKRDAMLAVMQQYFHDKNEKAFLVGPSANMRPTGRTMYSKAMFLVPRRWELHVWQLEGPPDSWPAQLAQDYAKQPVFAVVSGLAGATWAPVHRFCEEKAVPCLFPNADVPIDDGESFYSLYLSGGVLLEARMIAARIAGGGSAPPVVHQVYRQGDSGAAAADALAAALKARGIAVTSHAIAADAGPGGLHQALRASAASDALVLWLRAPDLAALGDAPARPKSIYVSGRMGGLEQAPVPPAWRERTLLAYPVDLPDRRRVRVDYALGWFSIRKIPIVDLPLQADTWLACGLLSETVNEIVDAFVPEYLVERVESMLEHRLLTGYYPRLSLAEHQRLASKGGYFVRFAEPTGTAVAAASDWLVP